MEKYPYMFSRQQFFSRDISRKMLRSTLYKLLTIFAAILTLYFLVNRKLPAVPVLELLGGVLILNIGFLFWRGGSGFIHWGSHGSFQKYHNWRFRFYLTTSKDPEPITSRKEESTLGTAGDVVLVQNISENTLQAVWGVTLRSTAIQIQPNVQDFLRRLYEIPAFIPLNVQMTLNSDPTQFSYTLFFGRMLSAGPTGKDGKRSVRNLLEKVEELSQDLFTALEINFPHFHFTRFRGSELVQGITGGIGGTSDPIIIPKHIKKGQLILASVGMFIVWSLVNFGAWFGLGLAVKESNIWIGISSLVYLAGCLIILIKKCRKLFFFHNMSKHHLLPFEPFVNCKFVRASHKDSLHIYNTGYQQLVVNKMYTLGVLNRNFRFNRTKFYRSLLSQVTTHKVGVTLNFYLRRVVEHTIPKYEAMFSTKFWRQWENLPDRHFGIARNVCGFYNFQVLITGFKTIDRPMKKIKPKEITSAVYDLDKVLLPVIRQGFPHCQPREVGDRNIWQYLVKVTDVFSKGHLPIFFSTGAQLSTFMSIPDEIHKVIPLIYPSEFATPLLNDSLEFGSTLNSENHQLESTSGLKTAEIPENILVVGDHRTDVQNAVQQVSLALLVKAIPMVIFDWDGTWSTPLGRYLVDHPVVDVEYFEIGKDLGLSLFALPNLPQSAADKKEISEESKDGENKKDIPLNPIPGHLGTAYIADVIRTFRLIFRWNEGEIAMLRNVLGNAPSPNITKVLADIATLDKQKHKSAVNSQLVLMSKDYLKTIFDTPLKPQFITNTWHNRDASLIINLNALRDPQLKHLFVRLFLTQLLYTREYFPVDKELKVSKCVVLPALETFWENSKSRGYSDSTFPLMVRLIEDNHPVIASTNVIEKVHPGVFGMFKSCFALRVQSPQNLKIMSDILHLDDFYTNSSSADGSHRHRSYQKRALLHMEPHQALVVRPTQSFPYIFQFFHNGSRQQYTFPELLEDALIFIPNYISQADSTVDQHATPLEREFASQPTLIPILYTLLTSVEQDLKLIGVVPPSQVKEDLYALMGPVFHESTLDPAGKQTLCDTVIKQLEAGQFLLPLAVGSGKASDQEGYELGGNAMESLAQWRLAKEKKLMEDELAERARMDSESENLGDTHLQDYAAVLYEPSELPTEIPYDPTQVFFAPATPEIHPTDSPKFIDGAHSLVYRLTSMYIFGASCYKLEGIAPSYQQLDRDLTNVEDHLESLTDDYSVMVLTALRNFHDKLRKNPSATLNNDQYEALLAEYEIIPARLG